MDSKRSTILNEQRGVPYDEFFRDKRGAEQVITRSAEQHRGRPMESYKRTDECEGITKKGEPCKARPVSGTQLCAGHTKQAEAAFKDLEG